MFSRRILIDIDAVFDTRLGLVLDKYPTMYSNIDMTLYRRRISEVIFSMAGIMDWDEEWRNRDIGCLKQAVPTELLYSELQRVVNSEISSREMSAPTELPELTFNIYPYVMSVEETGALRDSLKAEFTGIKVKVGRWCPHSLTPTVLRRNWDSWFTYDFYLWLDTNAKLLSNRIPNFVIYRPALYSSDMTTEGAEIIKRDNINPFTESKKFLAEYVTVEALDVGLFSAAKAVS